jgi:hypothetical protein
MTEPFVDSGTDWDRPILVGCCPSSGSTLLSVILDTHPRVFSGPELAMFSHPFLWTQSGEVWRERLLRYSYPATDVATLSDWSIHEGACPWIGFCNPLNFPWYGCDLDGVRARVPEWDSIRDLIELFFRRPLEKSGKSIWTEKSPTNIYGMSGFLERYPRGRGVVMLRDGRDVVCSLMKRGYGFARAASIWVLEAGLTLELSKHPRVHMLRYEDLVAEPRPVLRKLMDFLQLEASIDQLLDYQKSKRARDDSTIRLPTWNKSPKDAISSVSVGRWQDELSAMHTFVLENIALQPGFPGFAGLAGKSGRDILTAGGYAPSGHPAPAWDRLASWLLEEKTTLLSFGDPNTFHFRHAAHLGAVRGDAVALVPCLAYAVRGMFERDATIRDMQRAFEQERADWQVRHDEVCAQLRRRVGVKNGVKEALRSTWKIVKRRPAI